MFSDNCYPILDQNSLISIPYPRLNCLKTIPFTPALPYTYNYRYMGLPPPPGSGSHSNNTRDTQEHLLFQQHNIMNDNSKQDHPGQEHYKQLYH